jgi:uncharacterized protein YndB with AHSA1/START domain
MPAEIGVLAVRRSVLIKADPERIWQEFETLERMRGWFGTGHTLVEYEPRAGGKVLLEVDPDGSGMRQYGGAITVFDPGRELTFENDWIPNDGWQAPTLITLRLTPALDGTLVELFHHAFEGVGPNAADEHLGYEGGWTTRQLEALRNAVEG